MKIPVMDFLGCDAM